MPYLKVYLNEDELAFVREKRKNFLRTLVQEQMSPAPAQTPLEVLQNSPFRCRHCGGPVVGDVCRVCRRLQ